MDENIVLDTSKEKQFVKSIKGIKNLIKKSDGELKTKEPSKIKIGKIRKNRRKERGLVYLSHIPHGFYEHEMTQYFKQFGVVTNCRVIRSKRTGKSKGFAFVEFKETSVAQIVAETMNNYLMGKRLIKAGYIPPEEQKKKAMRKRWNSIHNPGNLLRQKIKKAYNETKDDTGELKRARKLLSNFLKTKKNLAELGINYDFFTPVDVPEVLLERLVKKEEVEDKDRENNKINKTTKKEKKNKKIKIEEEKPTIIALSTRNKKSKNESKDNIKQAEKKNIVENKVLKENKKKNVQPIENFMKIESDSESDSPYEFNSDDYEKMTKDNSEESDEMDSNDERDDFNAGSEVSDDDQKIIKKEKVPPKKRKAMKINNSPIVSKKQFKKKQTKVQQNSKNTVPVLPTKGKFEKQNTKKVLGNNSRRKNKII